MEKFNRKQRFLLLFYIAMVLLTVIAPYVGGKIFILLAVGLFCIAACVFEKTYLYVLLFGMFPFANIFKLSPGSTSMLTVCEFILCAYVIVDLGVLRRKLRMRKAFLFSWLLLICFLILVPGSGGILPIVKFAVKPLLVYFFFALQCENKEREQSIRLTSYTLSLSMVLMLALSLSKSYCEQIGDYMRVVMYGHGMEGLTRNGGLIGDPNYCALAIMATLTFLLVLYYFKKIKWEYWVLAIPMFLMGFTSYSKSYFLCAAGYVVILLLFVLLPKHRGMAVLLLAVLSAGVYLALSGKIEAINLVLQRFEDGDLTTGRLILNEVYMEYIVSNPKVVLLGEGYNIQRIYPYNNIHNLYLETFFQLGTIGSLLFVTSIISCIPKPVRNRKAVCFVPIAMVAVMYLALAGLNGYELPYYLVICICCACFISSGEKETVRQEAL